MSMFKNKVENQRRDLHRSKFRNLYLKDKLNHLEEECHMLQDKVICSQLSLAKQHEVNIKLKNDLQILRNACDNNLNEIDKTNERIEAILSIFREKNLSPIKNQKIDEDLEFKNNEINCLEQHLHKLRLKEAEKEDIIYVMKKNISELENEKIMLTKNEPQTIANLQEQIMLAKGRTVIANQEFKHLKNELNIMRNEVMEHLEKLEITKKDREIEGSVSMSFLGALWQSDEKNKKDDMNVHEMTTKDLENEVIYLNNEISKLEDKIESLNNQICLKEDTKRKLQNDLDNSRIKGQSIESILHERRRQCAELEDSGRQKYRGIKYSTMQKKEDIGHLAKKVDELSNSQSNSLIFVENNEENKIELLQQDIEVLEAKIKQLKEECKQL